MTFTKIGNWLESKMYSKCSRCAQILISISGILIYFPLSFPNDTYIKKVPYRFTYVKGDERSKADGWLVGGLI